jgi:hypothetical protein
MKWSSTPRCVEAGIRVEADSAKSTGRAQDLLYDLKQKNYELPDPRISSQLA